MTFKFSASEIVGAVKRLHDYVMPDNSYVVEIHRSKGKRSLSQNKYYWGVVISLFSQQTGYTSNEAHQQLAGMFLKYEAKGRSFVKSTTELNTAEFEAYLEQCRLFMWHEMNVHVPLPNEVNEDFMVQMSNIYSY